MFFVFAGDSNIRQFFCFILWEIQNLCPQSQGEADICSLCLYTVVLQILYLKFRLCCCCGKQVFQEGREGDQMAAFVVILKSSKTLCHYLLHSYFAFLSSESNGTN